jgi:hypothetical protein
VNERSPRRAVSDRQWGDFNMTKISIRTALVLSLVAGFLLASWLFEPGGAASEAILDIDQLRKLDLPLP